VAPGSPRAEIALIDLDDAHETLQLSLLVGDDSLAEYAVVSIEGVAIQPQQSRRTRGIKVETEALHHFFEAISA
jgi:hypothetical protein